MMPCSFSRIQNRHSIRFSSERALKIETVGINKEWFGSGRFPAIEQDRFSAYKLDIDSKRFGVGFVEITTTVTFTSTGTATVTAAITSGFIGISAKDTEEVSEGITVRDKVDSVPRIFRWLWVGAFVPVIDSE